MNPNDFLGYYWNVISFTVLLNHLCWGKIILFCIHVMHLNQSDNRKWTKNYIYIYMHIYGLCSMILPWLMIYLSMQPIYKDIDPSTQQNISLHFVNCCLNINMLPRGILYHPISIVLPAHTNKGMCSTWCSFYL